LDEQAMVFNGSSDYVQITSAEMRGIIDSETFSLAMWVYSNNVDKCIFGNNNTEFALEENVSDQLKFIVDGAARATTTETLTQNEWHHVVLTVNSVGNDIIYFNGVKTSVDISHSAAWGTATFTSAFGIGARSTGGINFEGHISNVMIFSKALTQQEITKLYHETMPYEVQLLNKRSIVNNTNDYPQY